MKKNKYRTTAHLPNHGLLLYEGNNKKEAIKAAREARSIGYGLGYVSEEELNKYIMVVTDKDGKEIFVI